MIELNHNIKVNDKVTITNLSWQVREAKVAGIYKVIDIPKNETFATLQREDDKQLLYVDVDTLRYLMGKKVDKEDFCVAINPKNINQN